MSITSINQIVASRPSTPRTKDPRTQEDLITLDPRSPKSQATTDNLGQYLVDKFGSPDHRPAFLRYAWRLDEAYIHSTVEQAFSKANNPRAYFIASCKRELERRGVA